MAERSKDKVVIVTGAGKGMGRTAAEAFAHEGGRVVLADIDPVAGTAAQEAIGSAGGQAVFVEGDITDDASFITGSCYRVDGGLLSGLLS